MTCTFHELYLNTVFSPNNKTHFYELEILSFIYLHLNCNKKMTNNLNCVGKNRNKCIFGCENMK